MWQSDSTHWRLNDGITTEIITWLDDRARYALSVTVHWRITGPIVVGTFDRTCVDRGFPASTLTDNAMVCTTHFSGGKGVRNAFEVRLTALYIEQKNSAPNHPSTPAGKSNVSNKPLRNGSPPYAAPTASTDSKLSSTISPTPATTTAPAIPQTHHTSRRLQPGTSCGSGSVESGLGASRTCLAGLLGNASSAA